MTACKVMNFESQDPIFLVLHMVLEEWHVFEILGFCDCLHGMCCDFNLMQNYFSLSYDL